VDAGQFDTLIQVRRRDSAAHFRLFFGFNFIVFLDQSAIGVTFKIHHEGFVFEALIRVAEVLI